MFAIPDNHRPTLSSDTAPDTARLKKSAKDESYNLGFDDQGDRYQYNGVRTTDDGNYVLIFDPARRAFVLHRVDSTFHMNLTRTPTDTNAESLRKQYPHLEVKTGGSARQPKSKPTDKAGASKATSTKAKDSRTRAAEDSSKAKGNKPMELTLPDLNAPAPTEKNREPPSEPEKKPKRPALSPVESEEDDDDDDGGVLEVEYPEGNPAAFRGPTQYMSTLPASVSRRFSEFAIERQSDEDEMFDGNARATGGYGAESAEEDGYEEGDEYEEEDEEERSRDPASPPGPFRTENAPPAEEPAVYTFEEESEEEDDEALLEAELSKAFDEAQENGGHDSDASVSEEE
jgi:hypothetical protein